MATVDIVKKFAEHAIKVEGVLENAAITGDVGRVLLILTMANKDSGVPQAEVANAMDLAKDVISKRVRSLVAAQLLRQERTGANRRIKRLYTTESGRALLSDVKLALQPPRLPKEEPAETAEQPSFFDDYDSKQSEN